SMTVRLGNGNGTFQAASSYAFFSSTFTFSNEVNLGDINSDGALDAVVVGLINDPSYDSNEFVRTFTGATQDGVSPLLPFSLKTKADALQTLSMMSQKLTQLTKQVGTIGAFQSRISTAISTLGIARENFTTAYSRISDADIAQESADLVRNRIIQQAAAA